MGWSCGAGRYDLRETAAKNMSMAFRELAQEFSTLIQEIDNSDVRVPEDSALIILAADLVPDVIRLLERGVDLLRAVERFYDPGGFEEPEDDDEDTLTNIALQISAEFAVRDLNDVAFFARNDLRTCLERLEATTGQRPDRKSDQKSDQKHSEMALASSCEAGIRRLRKALVSVESTLFEFEGEEAPQRKWYDVEVSLQIRKLYWNLRRETTRLDPDQPLADRLRAVLYRIVAFRELNVYPLLRVDDRVALRQLLSRILEWLGSKERNPLEGQHIWHDLEAFAGLLVQVSHRQELRDHDLALLSRAQRELFPFEGRPPSVMPPGLHADLQKLLGLDGELDGLILTGDRSRVAAWRAPLARLQRSLTQPPDPVPAIDLLD